MLCSEQWAKRWVLMVGLTPSPLPTHQYMLDYLWQKNLRQFIYKVGRTRPGRPLPTPPPPWKPTLTAVDWLSFRTSSTVQRRWATRWLTTCTYCRP